MLQLNNYEVNQACLPHISGNIIPHQWYRKIHTKSGKPDLVVITILAEVVYWHRSINFVSGDKAKKTSYSHFQHKFRFSKHQIRDAFIRLEDQKLAFREFRNGDKCSNELFLILNLDRIAEISSVEKVTAKDSIIQNNIIHLGNFAPSSSEISENIYKEPQFDVRQINSGDNLLFLIEGLRGLKK